MGLAGPGRQKINSELEPPSKGSSRSRAAAVIKFIEGMKIASGMHAGRPFKLRPWQKQIIRGIYGTKRNAPRPIRQALITLPRKNGKSQLAAALALCHLCGPEARSRGQIFSAAADRQQAGIIYREMKGDDPRG